MQLNQLENLLSKVELIEKDMLDYLPRGEILRRTKESVVEVKLILKAEIGWIKLRGEM